MRETRRFAHLVMQGSATMSRRSKVFTACSIPFGKARLFIAFVIAVTSTAAWAQEAVVEGQQLPGGEYRGRYIGFQPKYGEVHPHRCHPINAAKYSKLRMKSSSKTGKCSLVRRT